MTAAAEIARLLGNANREGRNWRCRCPVHNGASLVLADGRDGKLLAHCFGGCEWVEILDALRSRGVIGGAPDPERAEIYRQRAAADAKAEAERTRRRVARARALYRPGRPTAGTPAETYLRLRGITHPIPPVLRWLPRCPHRNGAYLPAMVAPVVNVAGEQVAIHKTFLRPDGSGKAELPKAEQRETYGPTIGAAVRLASPRDDGEILVAEGIETTLAAMRLFDLPGWATLCAPGLAALDLPAGVTRVVIAADHDTNGVGQRAALSAHHRWLGMGLLVRILLPPNIGDDFNDVLLLGVL